MTRYITTQFSTFESQQFAPSIGINKIDYLLTFLPQMQGSI